MKKSLAMLALAACSALGAAAQFLPASLPDSYYPSTAGSAGVITSMNCYSYGNVSMNGAGNYDLTVHAWTGTPNGMAWSQTPPGGTPSMGNGTVSASAINVDVTLTQSQLDSVYALVVYCLPGTGHYFDVYAWEGFSNTMSLRSHTQISSGYGMIHIDAINLDSFVVIWDDANKIFAQAGSTKNAQAKPVLASGATVLDPGFAARVPDIAIGNPNTLTQLNTHFVFDEVGATNVYVGSVTLNDIYTNAGGIISSFTIEDVLNLPSYGVPRIDCPDHADDDDWSYVVECHTGPQHLIFSGVMAASVSASPQHFVLNDGSMSDGGGNPHHDITVAKYHGLPVVAYDADYRYIYYTWMYVDTAAMMPYFNTVQAYIGFRMRNNGVLDNDRYWFLADHPDSTSFAPPALSGQNDASPDLYATYVQSPGGNEYITYKHVPWGSSSFRPTGITATAIGGLKVYPNPFTRDLTLSVAADKGTIRYEAAITDLLGRNLKHMSGTLPELNRQLKGIDFPAGVYFLQVNSGTQSGTVKLVKE